MKKRIKYVRIILMGLILWIIPFIAGFPFFDPSTQELTIDETFFKSIMIVIGALTGVILAVKYYKEVEKDYAREGYLIGITWLIVNWASVLPKSKFWLSHTIAKPTSSPNVSVAIFRIQISTT